MAKKTRIIVGFISKRPIFGDNTSVRLGDVVNGKEVKEMKRNITGLADVNGLGPGYVNPAIVFITVDIENGHVEHNIAYERELDMITYVEVITNDPEIEMTKED